jgi:integral membrane sensor domain MASE1
MKRRSALNQLALNDAGHHLHGWREILAAGKPAARADLLTALAYLGTYVALDRISAAHALSGIGFTLWDPSQACSLALLLIRGMRFAPLLLAAGVLADSVNGGFAIGVWPALAIDAIVAAGYTLVAALLRRFTPGSRSFQNLRDMTAFLIVLGFGVLAVSGAVGSAVVLMQSVTAPPQVIVGHLWVGEIIGIVGLLPALLIAPQAWRRWQELPAGARAVDITAFVCGLGLSLWIVFRVASSRDAQGDRSATARASNGTKGMQR